RLAEKVDRHDGLRIFCDQFFDRGRIDVECLGIDICKHWRGAKQGGGFGGRNKRKGRRDDLIPGADAHGHHRYLQGIRTVADSYGISSAEVICEAFFELPDLRPANEGRSVDDFLNCCIDLSLDGMVLSAEIHHLYVHRLVAPALIVQELLFGYVAEWRCRYACIDDPGIGISREECAGGQDGVGSDFLSGQNHSTDTYARASP